MIQISIIIPTYNREIELERCISNFYQSILENNYVEVIVSNDFKNKEIDPASANVLIQTLKWKAAKYYPKMFGDKVQNEHSGEITTNIISLGSGKNPNEANT